MAMLVWRWSPPRGVAFEDEPTGLDAAWPELNVFEMPQEYLLVVSLPGVRPDDVEVTVVGRTMTVSGERRRVVPDGAVAHLIEAPFGRLQRRLRLPANADISGIRTRMSDGDLLVRVPKGAPRRLSVTIARAD